MSVLIIWTLKQIENHKILNGISETFYCYGNMENLLSFENSFRQKDVDILLCNIN